MPEPTRHRGAAQQAHPSICPGSVRTAYSVPQSETCLGATLIGTTHWQQRQATSQAVRCSTYSRYAGDRQNSGCFVGYSHLGITSGLPVIYGQVERLQFTSRRRSL